MICFNETLANRARTIISARSTEDEIKAAYDITQAENTLFAIDQQLKTYGQISLELYNTAVRLDNQLRQDHKEIDELQACANRLGSLFPSRNQAVNSSDDIRHRLRMDIRGIFAATLVKHKVIEKIVDSLQQVADLGEEAPSHDVVF